MKNTLKKSLLTLGILSVLCVPAFAAEKEDMPKPTMRERVNHILHDEQGPQAERRGPRDGKINPMHPGPQMRDSQRMKINKEQREKMRKMSPEEREKFRKERREDFRKHNRDDRHEECRREMEKRHENWSKMSKEDKAKAIQRWHHEQQMRRGPRTNNGHPCDKPCFDK